MKLKYSSVACACINKTSLHSYTLFIVRVKIFRLINFREFRYPRNFLTTKYFQTTVISLGADTHANTHTHTTIYIAIM